MKNHKTKLKTWNGELKFSTEGNWTHNGEPVSNTAIANYFSTHLEYSSEHDCYVVREKDYCVKVVVEDTHIVVTLADTSKIPWLLSCTNGEVYDFDPSTLAVNSDNAIYCRVGSAAVLARIRRNVMQEIWSHIRATSSGRIVFTLDNRDYEFSEISSSSRLDNHYNSQRQK